MNFDKGIAAYLVLSAAMCTAITAYNIKNASVSADAPAVGVTAEPAAETDIKPQRKDNGCPADIVYAFTDSFGIPHVIIKNNGEQIYGYSLDIRYYDKAQKLISEDKADFDAIVPSGLSDGLERFIPKVEDAVYIDAAITRLKFLDSEKSFEPVFTENLQHLDDIKVSESQAECKFITISNAAVIRREGGSDLCDLRFDMTSTSDRKIKKAEFLVAEYDKDGKPVSAKPNGYIKEHIRKLTWEDAMLGRDEKKSLASNMALNPDCETVNIIVEHVEFEDRRVWANPDTLSWILSKTGK